MRVLKIVFALFATLSIPTFAAAAGKPPLQRAGKWQIVELGEYGIHNNDVSTGCVGDQSLLAKFYTIPNCSRRVSHTEGSITTADAQCRPIDSVLTYHEKIMKLDDNNIYIYMHLSYSPPVLQGTELEQSEFISFEHLKRLGACPVGQKPLKWFSET
jgi:hypothetical protein